MTTLKKQIEEEAMNHCDDVHASKGPLPVLIAREMEDIFKAGARFGMSLCVEMLRDSSSLQDAGDWLQKKMEEK